MIFAVVYQHLQQVVALVQCLGKLKAEGRKTTLVAAQLLAVAKNGSNVVCTFKLDKLTLASSGGRQLDSIAILTAVIVGAAVLAVKVIPSMGQRNGLPSAVVGSLGKLCGC